MVYINSQNQLTIVCPSFDYTEYPYILRGLIATIQASLTSDHIKNINTPRDIDFAIDLLLEMLPNEEQSKAMFSIQPQNIDG